MATQSYEKFFNELRVIKEINLGMTKDVIKNREELEVRVLGIQAEINIGIAMMSKFKELENTLENNKKSFIENKDFEYYEDVPKLTQEKT
jgi:hypothetical protein